MRAAVSKVCTSVSTLPKQVADDQARQALVVDQQYMYSLGRVPALCLLNHNLAATCPQSRLNTCDDVRHIGRTGRLLRQRGSARDGFCMAYMHASVLGAARETPELLACCVKHKAVVD